MLKLHGLPVHIGRLWPDSASAKAAPRGDVVLSFCHHCGFVTNVAYDPTAISYEPGYEYSLHHSPSHREFLEQTARRLVRTYELRDKDIVEVGCGSGFFLKLLCELGGNRGWGFDPAIPQQQTLEWDVGSMTLITQLYDETHCDVPCDLLISRSMFELIGDPMALLQQLRRVLGDRTEARVYLDIPNSKYVFRQRAIWNLFYEQCNDVVEATLVEAFGRAGFQVLDAGECLGDGYYLFVEAAPSDPTPPSEPASASISVPDVLVAMAEEIETQRQLWAARFQRWQAEGTRVVAWGSGGRAINFLNLIDEASAIEHVVDINPARHNGCVSGSGQRVIAPTELVSLRPDVVVITNSLYGEEIRQHVRQLGLECEFAEI